VARQNPNNAGPVVRTPNSVASAKVTAGSTGDGPANQKECDRWAGFIQTLMEYQQEASNNPNASDQAVLGWAAEVERAENDAMDRGCFIVY
jgi:hypothetical protein